MIPRLIRMGSLRSPLTKKVQSKTPQWQTLVADTRALIAAWTGPLDVRRVAPERRANEFPLEPGAHALPISVPRAVRKPRRLRSKPGFEGKGAFDHLFGHQSGRAVLGRNRAWHHKSSRMRQCEGEPGMPRASASSPRCTASQCKLRTQPRVLLLERRCQPCAPCATG